MNSFDKYFLSSLVHDLEHTHIAFLIHDSVYFNWMSSNLTKLIVLINFNSFIFVMIKARNKSYQTLLEKLVKSYHKFSKIVTKIWKKLQKSCKIIMKHEKPNKRLCVTRIKQILCIAGPVGGRDTKPGPFSQKLCTFWLWGGPGPCPPLQIVTVYIMI